MTTAPVSQASMVTGNAELYTTQLIDMWSSRATVMHEDDGVRLRWPGGEQLLLAPNPSSLELEASVPPGEGMDEFVEVITRSLERLARAEDAELIWR